MCVCISRVLVTYCFIDRFDLTWFPVSLITSIMSNHFLIKTEVTLVRPCVIRSCQTSVLPLLMFNPNKNGRGWRIWNQQARVDCKSSSRVACFYATGTTSPCQAGSSRYKSFWPSRSERLLESPSLKNLPKDVWMDASVEQLSCC